jgi:hypothetical protein
VGVPMRTAEGTSRGLTVARVIMFGQAVASLGIWVMQLLTTASHVEHNQDVPGPAVLVNIVNPLIAVLLAVAASFLVSRPSWARPLAMTMESIGIVGAIVTVVTGFYQAVVAILLAIGVIVLIRRHPVERS